MLQRHSEMEAIGRFLLCNERPICYIGGSAFNLIGLEGLVDAKQLSLLMTRPLGVKSVINPLAATGAQDPQGDHENKRANPDKDRNAATSIRKRGQRGRRS